MSSLICRQTINNWKLNNFVYIYREMVHTEAAIPGNSIGFERRGGRFISYKTGVVLAILFLAILLLVFFLGRFSTENLGKVKLKYINILKLEDV